MFKTEMLSNRVYVKHNMWNKIVVFKDIILLKTRPKWNILP